VELDAWLELARAVGIAKGVVVQPSVYGFDNTVLLHALKAAPDQLRGVVVVPPDVSEPELLRLHRLGVRGVRCNTRNLGGVAFDAIADLAEKIAPHGWALQVQVLPAQLDALATLLPTLAGPLVVDHLGFVDPRDRDLATRRLTALLDAGKSYVKISAPYRLSSADRYEDCGAIVKALVRSHPERLLWGSDWPHTELWKAMPDDAALIETMAAWLGDEAVRRTILVDTPEALFFSH
jgi:predicted TIM-barrel fold metal-dependent hydrolase